MMLFLISCLPGCILIHCISRGKSFSGIAPVLCLGFAAGVLFCFIHGFFVFPVRTVHTSFFPLFLKLSVLNTALPQVLIFGFFYFFSKDEQTYKIDAFFPLMAAFYAVFLPYWTLRAVFVPGFYELFALPLLCGLQLAAVALGLKKIVFFKERAKKIRYGLLLLAFLLLPIAAETLRWVTPRMFLCAALTVLFCVSSALFLCRTEPISGRVVLT
jgi:hypothetical protein